MWVLHGEAFHSSKWPPRLTREYLLHYPLSYCTALYEVATRLACNPKVNEGRRAKVIFTSSFRASNIQYLRRFNVILFTLDFPKCII